MFKSIFKRLSSRRSQDSNSKEPERVEAGSEALKRSWTDLFKAQQSYQDAQLALHLHKKKSVQWQSDKQLASAISADDPEVLRALDAAQYARLTTTPEEVLISPKSILKVKSAPPTPTGFQFQVPPRYDEEEASNSYFTRLRRDSFNTHPRYMSKAQFEENLSEMDISMAQREILQEPSLPVADQSHREAWWANLRALSLIVAERESLPLASPAPEDVPLPESPVLSRISAETNIGAVSSPEMFVLAEEDEADKLDDEWSVVML